MKENMSYEIRDVENQQWIRFRLETDNSLDIACRNYSDPISGFKLNRDQLESLKGFLNKQYVKPTENNL